MPGSPITRGPIRTAPNLRSKRLVYIKGDDLFRFVADNPST